MGRSVAFAYALAGLAVSASVVVIAASTVGVFGDAAGASTAAADPGAIESALASGEARSELGVTDTGELVEYVYVEDAGGAGDSEHDDKADDDRTDGRHHEDDDDEHEDDHEDDHDDDD